MSRSIDDGDTEGAAVVREELGYILWGKEGLVESATEGNMLGFTLSEINGFPIGRTNDGSLTGDDEGCSEFRGGSVEGLSVRVTMGPSLGK
jgi:hypothetical protein